MMMTRNKSYNPRRISLGIARALLLGAAAGGVASCSILYDLSGDQCNVDSDCAALGGVFSEKVCVERVCVDPGGCNTNSECIDAPGNFGEPSICVQRNCVPLKTTECPVILPQRANLAVENLRAESPVILGAYANIPASSLIGNQILNYDLVVTELADTATGLYGTGGNERRPVVMVVCGSNGVNQTQLDASISHLADDLRVPGVVAAMLADDLQYVFESKGKDAQIFFMSAFEGDRTLTALQDNGLLWHVLPGGEPLGLPYAPLLQRALTAMNLGTQTVKVASVTASDIRLLADITDTITAAPVDGGISFNGKSATENLLATPPTYLGLNVTSAYAAPDQNLGTEVTRLVDFQPNVVIGAAADEFLSQIVVGLEAQWPTGTDAPPRPFYLLSPYHFNNPALRALLESNTTGVRTRIVGINAPAAENQTLYNGYVSRFGRAYPDATNFLGYENFYDAAYYLMYAVAGAGTSFRTGADMANPGMRKLLSGSLIYGVGPANMPDALLNLFNNNSITLNGTMGPPNFDPSTGARAAYGSVWCIDAARDAQSDVLRYNAADKSLTGSFPASCIPAF